MRFNKQSVWPGRESSIYKSVMRGIDQGQARHLLDQVVFGDDQISSSVFSLY